MTLNKQEILNYLREIKLELEAEGMIELGLFGSYAKDKADENSDIDICFESTEKFMNKYNGFDYFGYLEELKKRISKHFNKSVDICDTYSILPERKKIILKGAIYI